MIIMLNGVFGVGKTTTAQELNRVIPNSMILDPEAVGQMLRSITQGVRTQEEDTDDFQDITLWRTLTVDTAQHVHDKYRRSLIIPMTVVHPTYLQEIKTGLAQIDPVFYHFCLIAPLTTIQQRLLARGEAVGSWAWQRTLSYVPLFNDPIYQKHINTDGCSIADIVGDIYAQLPQFTA